MAKLSPRNRVEEEVRDPWRRLREQPGVTVKETARAPGRPEE